MMHKSHESVFHALKRTIYFEYVYVNDDNDDDGFTYGFLYSLQAQQAGQSKDNEEKKKSSPAEVPRITPHVDLPPQVLQVGTELLQYLPKTAHFCQNSNVKSVIYMQWTVLFGLLINNMLKKRKIY